MNNKIKIISAAMLAASMCASFAGCANNEKPEELTESNIESHIESIFGGGSSSNKTSSSTLPESSEPEKITFAPTDEIKSAALDSGLIQLNNDIFQRGGYMTVADFVDKYKDSYDITYSCPINHFLEEAGTYDECKDYLLEYCDEIFEKRSSLGVYWAERSGSYGMGVYPGAQYYLTLKDKNNNTCPPVIAYVVNATSPDEKITLDKAIVAEVEPNRVKYEFTTPEWFPLGLNNHRFSKDYDSENQSYNVTTIGEALESKGIKKNTEFKSDGWSLPPTKEENFNTYWTGDDNVGCYIIGEENLFGAKPLYFYKVSIDPNTNKVQHADLTLEYFIKE